MRRLLFAFVLSPGAALAANGYIDLTARTLSVATPNNPLITPHWAAGVTYPVSAVEVGPDGLTLYKQFTSPSCVSGSTGPTGYNAGIADGTCSWTTAGLTYIQNNSIDVIGRFGHVNLVNSGITLTGTDGGSVSLTEGPAGLTFTAGSTAVTATKVTAPAITATGPIKLADGTVVNGTCTTSVGTSCVPPVGTSTNSARDGALAVTAENAALAAGNAAAASQGPMAGVSAVAGNVTGVISGTAPNKTLTLTAPAGSTPPASAGYLSTTSGSAFQANSFSTDFLLTGTTLGLNMPAGELLYRPATGNATYAAFVPRTTWPTAPSLTSSTPGDLAVNCSTATGNYWRIGNQVHVNFSVTCVPTYTTATGTLEITNLPFTAATGSNWPLIATNPLSSFTWPGSASQIQPNISGGTTYIQVTGLKSGGGGTGSLAITAITSGSTFTFSGAGEYDTNASQ